MFNEEGYILGNNTYGDGYYRQTEENKAVSKHSEIRYERYYDSVWVKEQPFYKAGMSKQQIEEEINYLNNHLDSFYEGNYVPLWKQLVYDKWFK